MQSATGVTLNVNGSGSVAGERIRRSEWVGGSYMRQERSAGLVVFRRDAGAVVFLLLHYGWGHWGFSKGNIEPGEQEKEAAIREMAEETGLTRIRLIDEFAAAIEYVYRKRRTMIHKTVTYFLAETPEREVRLSFEHTGYLWLPYRDAVTQLSYDNDKKVLRAAKETIEQRLHVPRHSTPQ